jgi:hypothetical protein
VDTIDPAMAFKIVNSYLGWGDPGEGGIWFVGIEEASDWGIVDEDYPDEVQIDPLERAWRQIKRLDQRLQDGWYEYSRWKPKERKSPVLEVMAEIASDSSGGCSSLVDYKKDQLWRAGCKVFQTNLYPLGRPTTSSWPPHYKKLFDLEQADFSRYEERVKKRLDKIKVRWVESEPQATVCFGTSSQYKDKFQYCFLDGQGLPLTEHPTYKIFFNDAHRVLICQHPASRWWRKGGSDKEKLKFIKGKLMDEWKVVLP